MRYNKEYWKKRLDKKLPDNYKKAIKRAYEVYLPEDMPQGICDPMYILNVLCYEIGIGDGQGNFKNIEELIPKKYKIVRMYKNHTPSRITITGLTLAEAQKHCQSPNTRQAEVFFDGYEEE